jgi:hypothetical protein
VQLNDIGQTGTRSGWRGRLQRASGRPPA